MAATPKIIMLKLADLVVDYGAFQLRAAMDPEMTEKLARSMRDEGFRKTNPIIVFKKDGKWYIIDGFHRRDAAYKVGIVEVPCEAFDGTELEAIKYGIAMNRDHGHQLEYPQDFKAAALKMKSRSIGNTNIAKALWPNIPFAQKRSGKGSSHPKEQLVRSWTDGGTIKKRMARDHAAEHFAKKHLTEAKAWATIRGEELDLTDVDGINDLLERYFTADGTEKERVLRAKLKEVEADLKAIKVQNDTAESIRETIFGIAKRPIDPVPSWLVEHGPPDHPGVPMTVWSDWHWGEVVKAEEVGGCNEFNRRVARTRLKTLIGSTISLAYDYMVNPEYPGMVICLGGDMVSGIIHEELEQTNDGTIQETLAELENYIAGALEIMADKFGRLYVPCVVGNHGRMHKKPRAKGKAIENFEWGLYTKLEQRFVHDERFRFDVSPESDVAFNVQGHRFLLTHGDNLGVRGGDGIIGMLGPVARGALKMARSEAQIGREFDTIIMGHWHTYIPRGEAAAVIVNGALKGYDEFARLFLRAPYSRPSQALWFVHPKHGITCQWPVFLEKVTTGPGPASCVFSDIKAETETSAQKALTFLRG
jgi:predicted phosphodiesterase